MNKGALIEVPHATIAQCRYFTTGDDPFTVAEYVDILEKHNPALLRDLLLWNAGGAGGIKAPQPLAPYRSVVGFYDDEAREPASA